uniref:Uncharacterized protein n=1 Tax=Rangifer tarandus platyrhynchus TaxID=3082113 RepID=A0ACB0F7P2_RANTA|nr:unnamed protein product [Rangifer tarandus platyrhynchus]
MDGSQDEVLTSAEVQATVRSTRKELRKSPSECTAPSRAGGGGGGIAEAPLLRGRLCPGRFQLLSERKSWGGGAHWTPRLRGQSTERSAGPQGPRPGERADTVGAPGKARRPGSQRRTRERRGAPAHSHRRRPEGGPSLFPARLPPALLGTRLRLSQAPARDPGRSPHRLRLLAAVTAAAQISLFCTRARVSRDVRLRSREIWARLPVKLRVGALTDTWASVSVPRPGRRCSEHARNRGRPAGLPWCACPPLARLPLDGCLALSCVE